MTAHKLTTAEKEAIKLWLSECFFPIEVRKFIREHFSKEVSIQTISYYATRYRDEIALRRREFLNKVFEIPESHAAFRIHRLTVMFRRNFPENVKDCIELLKQIREEVRFISEVTSRTFPNQSLGQEQPRDDLEKIIQSAIRGAREERERSASDQEMRLNTG